MPEGETEGRKEPGSNMLAEKDKAGGWVPLGKKLWSWFKAQVGLK